MSPSVITFKVKSHPAEDTTLCVALVLFILFYFHLKHFHHDNLYVSSAVQAWLAQQN